MANTVIINGKNLADFGAIMTDAKTLSAPNPQYETIEVDGRNGDLLIDRGRYSNYELQITGVLDGMKPADFYNNFVALRGYLMAQSGYVRIEESALPDHYRTGRLMGGIAPNTSGEHYIRAFTLRYWCVPQMWLKSGEIGIDQTAGFKVFNPTMYTARPLIRVYGTGTLTVGTNVITVAAGADSYIDIDSEIYDCYEGTNNRNALVSMAGGFPVFESGETEIQLSGITRVVVTPRWYTL